MAEFKHDLKLTDERAQSEVSHQEHGVTTPRGGSLVQHVEYDGQGFKGIVKSPYVFGAALLASFGGFSFGYDQGVISLILVMPQFRRQYPQVDPGHAHYGFNTGFMTGMLELGAFLGCLFLPYVADRWSRKWALTAATAFFCVGAIIQTASHNYGTLVAGRTIGGIGVGTLAMGAPLYISEIAPPNVRGSLLVLEQIAIVIGAIVSYWITYGTRTIPNDWAFRLPFLLQMIPAVCVGAGIHFFPYSPRWLVMVGRNNESLLSLSKLRNLPVTDYRIQLEHKGIIAEIKMQREIAARQHPNATAIQLELWAWLDLFRPRYFRRTLISMAVSFFQQFSGINAFVYYAPTFFTALGQSYDMSLILAGMINICQLVAGLPAFALFDMIGRRNIAIFGGIAMAIPHAIMAGIVNKYSSSWSTHTGIGWFGVALVYIYVLAFAFTYGPLAWVLPAELWSNTKRAKGVGIAVAVNWAANFIIGVVVPQMLISLGWGTYLFFACFCAAAAVFAFFFIPEVAGKTLEEVGEIFGDSSVAEEEAMRERIAEQIYHNETREQMNV